MFFELIKVHLLMSELYVHVVASECYRIHFISEKYKTVQLFMLHFLQNSPVMQLYTTASECKGV